METQHGRNTKAAMMSLWAVVDELGDGKKWMATLRARLIDEAIKTGVLVFKGRKYQATVSITDRMVAGTLVKGIMAVKVGPL